MATHLQTGHQGEAAACQYLRDHGYHIHMQNYRFRRAEIDIIAEKAGTLVFVEVKARASDAFGYPEDFVDATKQAHIQEAAEAYIDESSWDQAIRFDIIAINTRKQWDIQHFEDAF